MKSVVIHKPGHIELVDVPAPDSPPPGWVEVEIAHVGLCGTDYHIFEGNQPFLSYPRVIGHELSGRIATNAEGFRAGELVIVNPYVACGTCHACQRSKPNCCYNIRVLGVHVDGGLTERILLPARNAIRAEGLTAEQAATVEFLAIGAHAVRRSELTSQDRVLVVGAGPIGLGTALFARERGAQVHLLDASQDRLELVSDRFGFTNRHTLAEGYGAVLAATEGDGFDVLFDATGSNRAIERGFDLVAHGGTYVLLSVVKGTITFEDASFHKREMRLIASRNATIEDFRAVVNALTEGRIDASKLITQVIGIDETAQRMPQLVETRTRDIKILISVR
jgi:2-desacetyl-2-hydroxyethyl bacteriochlorophyllide A dehydrogenase